MKAVRDDLLNRLWRKNIKIRLRLEVNKCRLASVALCAGHTEIGLEYTTELMVELAGQLRKAPEAIHLDPSSLS